MPNRLIRVMSARFDVGCSMFLFSRGRIAPVMMMSRNWIEPLRSPLALLLFFGTAAAGVVADLWSKAAAVEHLKNALEVRFIPGLVHFTYTENHGAVFGLGKGQIGVFLSVSALAIGFLVFLFLTSGRARVYQLILGMLLAGVIGNMYDRLKFGYVRDMIHGLPGWHWPDWVVRLLPARWQPAAAAAGEGLEVFPWVFNIADSLLCVGVAAMLVYSFVSERRRKREAGADGEEGRTALKIAN
jgi:signal peptidase II